MCEHYCFVLATCVLLDRIPTLWSGLFLIGQTLLTKYLFLGDRNGDSKFIEVRHRYGIL